MKLLDEIVEAAASDEVRLATILRKTLVAAVRLKNDQLRSWTLGELNGFKNHEDLPPYRVFSIHAKGFFLGPLQGQLNDQPLPSLVLKEQHRWWAETAYLMEPISSYETVPGKNTGGSVRLEWPADMVAHYQSKFFQGWTLNRAWQDIPIGAIVAIVDTVRTRLLQFALELQEEIGAEPDAIPEPDRVEHAVQTIILGGMNIVGSSVTGDVQLLGQQLVVEGDILSLTSSLEALGIGSERVSELKDAIDADVKDGATKGFGDRVLRWLADAGKYVGKEGVKMAAGAAQAAATAAVRQYLGLPPA